MRKFALAAITTSFAALAACSGGTDTTTTEPDANATATTAAATPAAAIVSTVVDANTATETQLGGIAGVTPEIAKGIVAGRPYADAVAFEDALGKMTSKDAAADLMKRVFVPVNLNTASEEAIKRIPGMTPKMVHEFLEYRPYTDMAEFDREIGKYVYAAEVARLRSYTTL